MKHAEVRFDPSKPCQTRNGHEVRIYATDATGIFSIHGAIKNVDEWGSPQVWTEDGKYNSGSSKHPLDLVNTKLKIKVKKWAIVHRASWEPDGFQIKVVTEKPDLHQCSVFALIPLDLEFTEGEGVA